MKKMISWKSMKEKEKENLKKRKSDYLHNSTRVIMIFFRVIGLLPLSGLTCETSKKLRYTLRTPYTIYYSFSFCGQLFIFLSSLNHLCQQGISLFNATCVLLYTSSMISFSILGKTGQYWPSLMRTVEKMESHLPSFRKNYSRTVTVILVLLLATAIADQTVSLIYKIDSAYSCDYQTMVENFFKMNSPWIFNYTPVTMWKGIISEIIILQSEFVVNCNDWLVILISLYVTEYFIVHTERLKKAIKEKHFSCSKFRTEYLRIVYLLKLINVRLGIFLMMSVGGNLHWICVHIFYGVTGGVKKVSNDNNTLLEPAVSTIKTKTLLNCSFEDLPESKYLILGLNRDIYYPFEFSILVTRAMLVLILAARIQSNALVPVLILYDLPNSKYSGEVQRYISQINNIKVALSGMGFFYVTRKMILSLIGAIVTYVLVLFQFNQ